MCHQGFNFCIIFSQGKTQNRIIYKSAKPKMWELVELEEWCVKTEVEPLSTFVEYDEKHWLVKKNFCLMDEKKNETERE